MNTEFTITLENGTDINMIRHMIENIKGVLKVSVHKETKMEKDSRHEEWMRKIHELSSRVDPSIIDMSDERTRYIMSK